MTLRTRKDATSKTKKVTEKVGEMNSQIPSDALRQTAVRQVEMQLLLFFSNSLLTRNR